MVDLQKTVELIGWLWQVAGSSVALPRSAWVQPFWAGLIAVVAGLVFALWGARLLRTLVVLLFMTAGAVAGKQFATSLQVDMLIGLVVGAGIAGLVGYLFYRWWLGLTIGTVAALLLAATFSAPRLLAERPGFEDFRLGVGSGQYITGGTPQYEWQDFRTYFWEQRREVLVKSLGPVALAGLLGLIVSLIAPRVASIVGTSVLGVGLLAAGSAALMATKWPATWSNMQTHASWLLGALACFWLFAVLYQASRVRRPVVQQAAVPMPAPTA